MNMTDVYSADTPKPEKRKKSSIVPTDDNETLPKKRKMLNARNESEDEDEPQLKTSKVIQD